MLQGNLDQNIIIVKDNMLHFGGISYRCAVGRSGIKINKQEGDGATPAGQFPLRQVFYRADKIAKPQTVLPIRAIEPNDGWCDDPKDKNYNCLVKLPYEPSHEKLWRDDDIYDLFAVIGCNDDPVKPYAGSAIFLHVARPDYSPTEGCVALAITDLTKLLANLSGSTTIVIQNSQV